MNLQEWRAKQQQGEAAQLPSGLEIQVRRVGMLDLAEQGKIPSALAPKINELMKHGLSTVSIEQVTEFSELINMVCRACVVGPDGLDVGELSYEDRLAIFNWASAMSAKLQPFRGANTKPVGTG